jgi:hypothetical protein
MVMYSGVKWVSLVFSKCYQSMALAYGVFFSFAGWYTTIVLSFFILPLVGTKGSATLAFRNQYKLYFLSSSFLINPRFRDPSDRTGS